MSFVKVQAANLWVISQQIWTKPPLKSIVIYIFLKYGMVRLFETLHTVSKVQNVYIPDENI